MARRSNCFVFAVYLFVTRGGYIGLRRSRHIWGLHWFWSKDMKRWIHYAPNPPKGLPSILWHKVLYRGVIRRGDSVR